ncbi:MAG TPA: hypothetical protein VFC76_05570 [Oscillospiraceae bacterium]|nr:hypothetical protein [Oscillospiraceae bacterium]
MVKEKGSPAEKAHVASKGFGKFLFYFWQFTWGLPVNIIGIIMFFVMCKGRRREKFCNSVITYIPGNWGGVSLGVFIFMCEGKDKKWEHDTKIHEYGHTIQCLLLGVFYWLVIGIPSAVWCNFPPCIKYREKNNVSYYALYCEKWANKWGESWSRQKREKYK